MICLDTTTATAILLYSFITFYCSSSSIFFLLFLCRLHSSNSHSQPSLVVERNIKMFFHSKSHNKSNLSCGRFLDTLICSSPSLTSFPLMLLPSPVPVLLLSSFFNYSCLKFRHARALARANGRKMILFF